MKIKSGFILKKTAGRNVAISMGDEYNGFKGMVTLTGIAPFYWELLQTEQTMDSLAESAVKEYNISKEQALADLEPFIEKLKNAGIIDG